MSTRVVHCNRSTYDVLIDRTTRWGCPFYPGVDGTRLEVLDKYEAWIKTQPHMMAKLYDLKDRVLGCWCKPDKPCHGDVLARLADELP